MNDRLLILNGCNLLHLRSILRLIIVSLLELGVLLHRARVSESLARFINVLVSMVYQHLLLRGRLNLRNNLLRHVYGGHLLIYGIIQLSPILVLPCLSGHD